MIEVAFGIEIHDRRWCMTTGGIAPGSLRTGHRRRDRGVIVEYDDLVEHALDVVGIGNAPSTGSTP